MARFNWETLNERLTWEEIKEKYPDSWVILNDCVMERIVFIREATVVGTCNDSERLDIESEIVRNKLPYMMRRTRDLGGSVICL